MNARTDSSHSPANSSSGLRRRSEQTRVHERLEDSIAEAGAKARSGVVSKILHFWKTQREEDEKRRRRHVKFEGWLLTLLTALFALVLFLVYRQAMTGQARVSAEVAEMRQELERFFGGETVAQQTLEKLDRLADQLEVVASSLRRSNQIEAQDARTSTVPEHDAGKETEAIRAATINHLAAEQTRLFQALESLRAALQALERRIDEVPAASSANPPPNAAGEERQVAESTQTGVANAEVSGPTRTESDAEESGSAKMLLTRKGDYALQLIGFFSRQSLDKFVASEQLPARVYLLRETYKGRPWYTLIHSLHEDDTAGKQALFGLPVELAQLDPWIRPLSEGTELQIIEVGPKPN